jgi:RNA polymerase sigma factor (sigma-70 family)
MVEAHTMEDFYSKNSKDVYRIIRHTVKNRTEEDIKDYCQAWYLHMDKYDTLSKFQKGGSSTFDTYIFNCIRNFIIPILNRENREYKSITSVSIGDEIVDALDRVQANCPATATSSRVVSFGALPFAAGPGTSKSVEFSMCLTEEYDRAEQNLKDFLVYLKRVPESPEAKDKMKNLIKWSVDGYNGTEAAKVMGLSAMSISNTREDLRKYYEKYKASIGETVSLNRRSRKLSHV